MKKVQFKTNINCGGCLAKVTPFLEQSEGIIEWNVDTDTKDKILTVMANGITEEQIISTVEKAGFKATLLERK